MVVQPLTFPFGVVKVWSPIGPYSVTVGALYSFFIRSSQKWRSAPVRAFPVAAVAAEFEPNAVAILQEYLAQLGGRSLPADEHLSLFYYGKAP